MPDRRTATTAACLFAGLLTLGASTLRAVDLPAAPDGVEFFEQKIRPVLVDTCYQCHGPEAADAGKLKGGLRLDSREALLKGGESGKPAVVPGNAEGSLLIRALRHTDPDLAMPPKKKLGDRQIADFVTWVNLGAPDPRVAASEAGKPKADAQIIHLRELSRLLEELQAQQQRLVNQLREQLYRDAEGRKDDHVLGAELVERFPGIGQEPDVLGP